MHARTEYVKDKISQVRCQECFRWNAYDMLVFEESAYQFWKTVEEEQQLPGLAALFDASPLDSFSYECPKCKKSTFFAWDEPEEDDVKWQWKASGHMVVVKDTSQTPYKHSELRHGGAFRLRAYDVLKKKLILHHSDSIDLSCIGRSRWVFKSS